MTRKFFVLLVFSLLAACGTAAAPSNPESSSSSSSVMTAPSTEPETVLPQEDPERPHLHRYDIGENGDVTASFLELECPERESSWAPDCVLLPEKGEMFTILDMGADSAGYVPVSAVSPEGEGMYLPLPKALAEQYDEHKTLARPYPLAVLPGGELLFLAKSMDIA